jgi:hypothetical protein
MRAIQLAATACATFLACGLTARASQAPARESQASEPAAVADLIRDLGSDDYGVREQASARLERLGPDAVDALLTAAEVSSDLEIALRARWLVQSLPLTAPHDSAAAAELITRYEQGGATARRRIAHQLLRLDGDAGIEPLARFVRLDRDPAQARLAAALLAREWRPTDAYWPGIADRITAALGTSTRPAARFLQALVSFSRRAEPGGNEPGTPNAMEPAAALAEAGAALALIDRAVAHSAAAAAADTAAEALALAADEEFVGEDEAVDMAARTPDESATLRTLRRCYVEMLVTAGRREEALAQAAVLFDASRDATTGGGDADTRIAADLVWLAEHGLPESVSLLEGRWPGLAPDSAVATYAAALAVRQTGDAERARAIAERAFTQPRLVADEFTRRLQAALVLTKWGAPDWVEREYQALLTDERTPPAEFALAGILFAEFLHDQGDDARAALVLGPVITGREGRVNEDGDSVLPRLQRDPASIVARKHYFEACAAANAGDQALARQRLETALQAYAKEVDVLITLFQHPANTPDERADAAARVARALRRIEDEIQALPDDPNGYNEYAWLVANTEGDVAKALRYSRLSLEKSFDSASYLDTLAHCLAAAGERAGAVRTQSLALRMEPHNRTILRNLMRFQARAAERQQP